MNYFVVKDMWWWNLEKMSPRKSVRRGGRKGIGAGRNQSEGQPAVQAADRTTSVTLAKLVAMKQRYKDFLFKTLAKRQLFQQTQTTSIQTPTVGIQITVVGVQAPVVVQNVSDMVSAEAKHLRNFRKYNP